MKSITISNTTNSIVFSGNGLYRTIEKTAITGFRLFTDPMGNSDEIHIYTENGPFVIRYDYVLLPVTADAATLLALLDTWIHGPTYWGTFTNATLAANILTINHGGNAHIASLTIKDPVGVVNIVSWTEVDLNTATVDFGGAIPAGNWTWTIILT
jgi:hypothetical protein